MEENFIYDDIGTEGDLGTLISELQTRNDVLQEHVSSLERDIKKLCDKITDMQKIQDNLSKNISELYNTAKNELSRKDRRIAELQSQLDEMIFRRNPPHTGFKRKWEEPDNEESNKKTCSESAGGPQFERVTENRSGIDNNSNHKGREGICHSNNEKVDEESNSRQYSHRQNDSGRRVQSRGTSRERRETQTDIRDLKRDRGDCQRYRGHSQSDRGNSQNDRGNSQSDKGYSQRDRGHSQSDRGNSQTDRGNSQSDRGGYQREREDLQRNRGDPQRDRRNMQVDRRDSQRDTRESQRDRKDNYRDNNRDWGGRKDNAEDRRETRNRESRRDTLENNRSLRDRSRGRSRDHRASYRDLKVEHGEHRDNRMYSRDHHTENRDRGHKQNRDEPQEISKPRNEKHGDVVCIDDEQMDPQSSSIPVLSTDRSTSGPILDTMEIQDDSREEGEVSDEDVKNQYTVVNEVSKKPIDFGKNLPFDDRKAFNVQKFIQKQGKMHKGQKAMKDSAANEVNNDHNDQANTVRVDVKTTEQKPILEVPAKVIKMDCDDSKTKLTNDKCKNMNSAIRETAKLEHSQVTSGRDGSNVNIISQIILQGGSKDMSTVNATKSQAQVSKSSDNKNRPPTVVPKLDLKKRESRVPRNLTEELNINLDRSKKRHVISSSEKKTDPRMTYHLSPAHRFVLSDDGEIPKLKLFSDPDSSEAVSSGATKDTNPVTEFQIFKTNLPCLEKSNSLSSISVQIQTPSKDGEENSQKKFKEASGEPKIAANKGASLEHHSNDICTINLDMLNMDIKQCKAEDFPNLVAHSDSNDKHNLPLEHVQKKIKSTDKQSRTDLGNKNNSTYPVNVDKNPLDLSQKVNNQSPSKVSTNEVIEKRQIRSTAQHKQISVDVEKQNAFEQDTTKNEHHHASTPLYDISTNDDEAEDLYLSYRSDPTYFYKLITPIKDHLPIHMNETSKETILDTHTPVVSKTLTSPVKIHIPTSTDRKENTVKPCQRKEKLKPPLIDDVKTSMKKDIGGDDKKKQKEPLTKSIINTGTEVCSNSKGPSVISSEKTTKSVPKKCLNSKRSASKGSVDAQNTSNASTQVDSKIKTQNTSSQQKVSDQPTVSSHPTQSNTESETKEKCRKAATIISNVATKDTSQSTTTKKNVQTKSLHPKGAEKKTCTTNANNGNIDISSSSQKDPVDKKIDLEITPANRTDSTESNLNRSSESKSSTRSIDRRRRRCAIKLV